MRIQEACRVATQFFEETMHVKPAVLSVGAHGDSLHVELEVLEENPIVKSRGLPTVYDRHTYEIHLNEELEILGYARKNGRGEDGCA